MATQRSILFLTGTRADFGKLKALIRATGASARLEPRIFATGMHLLARYGSTYDEIRKANLGELFLHFNQAVNTSADMDLVLANTITGLGHYIREFAPDLLVVHGDRVEALAGAIVGALNNVKVAHIEGGELSGTVDELIRHSITKLAHIHFVANAEARRRLVQMGESPASISIIGSPDIDTMLSDELPTLAATKAWYDLDFDRYFLFCYHPVTTEREGGGERVDRVISALEDSGENVIAIYPNNDHGADVILRRLERLRANPRFRVFPSLRFEAFLVLLRHAEAVVGNSSAGIREAPVYGVPCINIGTRQENRFVHPSIVNVPEDRARILAAMRHLPPRVKSLHFGTGDSATRFVRALEGSTLWDLPIQKQFIDQRNVPVQVPA